MRSGSQATAEYETARGVLRRGAIDAAMAIISLNALGIEEDTESQITAARDLLQRFEEFSAIDEKSITRAPSDIVFRAAFEAHRQAAGEHAETMRSELVQQIPMIESTLVTVQGDPGQLAPGDAEECARFFRRLALLLV